MEIQQAFSAACSNETWPIMRDVNATDSDSWDILHQNCHPEWPVSVCEFANICGLISTAIWFVVLFPQIVKNWKRKSVVGLSVLWATANFSASLINVFFVFRIGELPAYVKVSAIYMPTLQLLMLIQFWIYDTNQNQGRRWLYLLVCLAAWSLIIVLEVVVGIYQEMEWCAIVLWSIQTFPQVILNMQRQSTSGQSTLSVCISLVGKTTDFLSSYLLTRPLQFVIMAYFSSSMAYINGMQVVWYWRNRHTTNELPSPVYGGKNSRDDERGYADFTTDDETENVPSELEIPEDYSVDNNPPVTPSLKIERVLCAIPLRILFAIFISVTLLGYSVGLIWNTQSFIALIAPIGIVAVMLASYVHRKKVMGY
ncbi:cystinosin-like [Saccoglossus kowalevskii]